MSFVPVLAPRRLAATPDEWGSLRDLIHERTGVYYSDARLPLMVSRLEDRLRSNDAAGARDLELRLQFDDSGHEIEALNDLAAPHESYFLRESEQLDALVEEVLPARAAVPFRVWCAGCASGEEVYSVAYRLRTAPGPRRGVEVLGTDLSAGCIARARRGEYRDPAMRQLTVPQRDALFESRGAASSVRPQWREGVRFETRNLLDTPVDGEPLADVIFCRNVMIYFSEATRRKAAAIFYESLSDGGHLFLGNAESLHGVTRMFRPVTFRRGLAYRKD